MKTILQAYFISATVILMLAILVSLIIGTLFFFQVTDTNISNILIWLFGILLYVLAGGIFGYYLQTKIIIHLLIAGILFTLLFLLFTTPQGFTIIRMVCKLLAFAIATIVMQSLKQ